jgi:hypothetical protein
MMMMPPPSRTTVAAVPRPQTLRASVAGGSSPSEGFARRRGRRRYTKMLPYLSASQKDRLLRLC